MVDGLRIVADAHIPYLRGVLEPLGCRVDYIAGADITAAHVRDADALVIRTRTRADERLLAGSRVSLVATATIGTDHIDIPWCLSHGITVSSAPGCNAPGVAQWVLGTSLVWLGQAPQRRPAVPVLGIVGAGHVGGLVERWARAWGWHVMLCDPPRAEREGSAGFCSLGQIAAEADIVTFHTPLDASTRHLGSARFFASLRRRPLVLNAARGGVIDEGAALDALSRGLAGALAIDCWEGEPLIGRTLLERALVATPHIAGYSAGGKQRATAMTLQALAAWRPELAAAAGAVTAPPVPEAPGQALILDTCGVMADTAALRAQPERFEALRNGYNYRPFA